MFSAYRIFHRPFFVAILTLSFLFAASQDNYKLLFNEEGKLSSGMPSRIKVPLGSEKCDDIFKISSTVLLPLDYFEEEGKKIDTMASQTYKALRDSQSLLFRLLNCRNPDELEQLERIVHPSSDLLEWKLDEKSGSDELIPLKLQRYLRFIRTFQSISALTDTANLRKKLDTLNFYYKEFAPYRLKVGGSLLDTTCLRFVPYPTKDDPCGCAKPGKKYIAVELGIPYNLLTKDASVDSFEVIQYFSMKEFAIERYNQLLTRFADDIPKLKALQETVRKNTTEVEELLGALHEINLIKEDCPDSIRDSIERKWNNTICELKDKIDRKLGQYNCDSVCASSNILFCSEILPKWLIRLVWLNGELIRLNPFNFTNVQLPVFSATIPTESRKPLSDEEFARVTRDATTRIAFWTTAISHLQDSVMLMKPLDIDLAKLRLMRLIQERDSAQRTLDGAVAAKKEADAAKAKQNKDNKANIEELNGFSIVSKVKYKGWLIPYQLEGTAQNDKMWLRNYYNDLNRLVAKDRFHFTYPEDENVTLLVHNLNAGAAIKVTESLTPANDSSTFSIFATSAISSVVPLYSSLAGISPLVRKALQTWNRSVVPTSGTATVFSNTRTEKLTIEEQDSLNKIIRVLEEFKAKTVNVTLNVDGQTKTFSLNPKESTKNLNTIENVFNSLSDTCVTAADSCYIKYLKGLLALRSSPPLIDKPIPVKSDRDPLYFTHRHSLTDSIATYLDTYTIRLAESRLADSLGQFSKTSSFIKVGKFHHFALAAGIAYSPNAGSITFIDTTGGGFKINRDEDRARLVAGLRIYPFGIYNLKNPESLFRERRWLHRTSILIGTGIPKPLQNFYLGAGIDFFPGLTFSGGLHLQQQNQYEVVNGQIISRNIFYQSRGFYSLTIDPTLFVSAITSIFKN